MRPRFVVGRVCLESGEVRYRRGSQWVPHVHQATQYRAIGRAVRARELQEVQWDEWDYYFEVLFKPRGSPARSRGPQSQRRR